MYKRQRYSKGIVEHNYARWEIDLSKLKGLPDIVIPKHSKDVTAANGLCYKLAPLLLPAKVDKGKIALLYTRRSSLIGWTFDSSLKSTEGTASPLCEWRYLQTLLTHLHFPFEVITEDTIEEELDEYKVLIAGYWATMGSKEMAERIKQFVRKGGVVIFYPEAFVYNWDTTKNNRYSPGYGLDKFFGCRIKSKISGKELTLKISEDISTSLKRGDTFKVRGLITPLERLEKGKILATLEDTGEPLIISANNGHTYYLGFVPGISYSTSNPNDGKLRALFEYIIGKSKLKKPVLVKGDKKSYLVYTRILHGKNYYLLAFCNDYWEKQTIKSYLNFLPKGNYEMIDVTEDGKPLVITPNSSSQDLSTAGISLSLSPLSCRVLIIRKANQKVILNFPEYELSSIINNYPIDIVVGKSISSSLLKSVKKLQKELRRKGISARLLKDEDIPIVNKSTSLSEEGYPLGTFHNKIISSGNNLILVGNIENNRLISNLSKKGSYTYDKLLEDVDSSYPGKGRGIIQICESINKPYFCPTDRGRDAILISGSDEKGIEAAIKRFMKIIKQL